MDDSRPEHQDAPRGCEVMLVVFMVLLTVLGGAAYFFYKGMQTSIQGLPM